MHFFALLFFFEIIVLLLNIDHINLGLGVRFRISYIDRLEVTLSR